MTLRHQQGCSRRWIGPILLAVLAGQCCGAEPVQPDATRYRQKTVTLYAAVVPEVPSALQSEGTPRAWALSEQGPVGGLQEFARTEVGAIWLGSSRGAARFDPAAAHPWDRWQYFSGRRWMPDDEVTNIVVDGSAGYEVVWIRTKTGAARIEFRPMTLAEKAAHYEQIIDARHVRHGFVSGCDLKSPRDFASSQTRDDDNDGLWTAMYLAAECYRFAATGEADARAKAQRSMQALFRLEEIDPVTGFFARSFRTQDEPAFGETEGEWHRLEDGKTEWKGDTSSDEQVGHYYACSVYYDLVASDAERPRLREHVARMTDYLLDHGDELLDVDGKPTRWGRYRQPIMRRPKARMRSRSAVWSFSHFSRQRTTSPAMTNIASHTMSASSGAMPTRHDSIAAGTRPTMKSTIPTMSCISWRSIRF